MEKLKVQVWIYFRAPEGLRVLLFKTNEERGGFWQPVTGSVEEGEEPIQGALREASEESGLTFEEGPIDLGFEFVFEGKGTRAGQWFRERAFGIKARAESPVKLDPREHVEFRWVEPSVARSMLRFAANAQGLEALLHKNV